MKLAPKNPFVNLFGWMLIIAFVCYLTSCHPVAKLTRPSGKYTEVRLANSPYTTVQTNHH